MKLTIHDITSARLWAESQQGETEDSLLDLYEYKLLSLVQESHDSSARYHARQQADCGGRLDELEGRFKVEPVSDADEF